MYVPSQRLLCIHNDVNMTSLNLPLATYSGPLPNEVQALEKYLTVRTGSQVINWFPYRVTRPQQTSF